MKTRHVTWIWKYRHKNTLLMLCSANCLVKVLFFSNLNIKPKPFLIELQNKTNHQRHSNSKNITPHTQCSPYKPSKIQINKTVHPIKQLKCSAYLISVHTSYCHRTIVGNGFTHSSIDVDSEYVRELIPITSNTNLT